MEIGLRGKRERGGGEMTRRIMNGRIGIGGGGTSIRIGMGGAMRSIGIGNGRIRGREDGRKSTRKILSRSITRYKGDMPTSNDHTAETSTRCTHVAENPRGKAAWSITQVPAVSGPYTYTRTSLLTDPINDLTPRWPPRPRPLPPSPEAYTPPKNSHPPTPPPSDNASPYTPSTRPTPPPRL